jgi:hypothetical protein
MTRRLLLLLLIPILLLGVVWSALRYATCLVVNPAKAWAMAYQLDELANVGANGKANTTISARAGRAQLAGKRWGCVLCRLLDRIQPGHCALAVADAPKLAP